MESYFSSFLETPVGKLAIRADDNSIYEISFLDNSEDNLSLKSEVEQEDPNRLTIAAAAQLQEYFAGTRKHFNIPLKQKGTEFQQEVWQKLLEIPFGVTTSYAKFSSHKPLAIRAIAAANGKNNLAIVVPCHRVIGSDGRLVGYAGGLWRKQWLLQHERKVANVGQAELEF